MDLSIPTLGMSMSGERRKRSLLDLLRTLPGIEGVLWVSGGGRPYVMGEESGGL